MCLRLKVALLLSSALLISGGELARAGRLQQGLVVHLPLDGDLSETTLRGVTPQAIGTVEFLSTPKLGAAGLRVSSVPPSHFNFVSLGDDLFGVLNFGEFFDFAVSFWIRSGPLAGVFPLVANRDESSLGNTGWGISLGAEGRLIWDYTETGNGADPRVFQSAAHLLDDGLWHHVAVSFQRAGDATTFVDGVLIDTQPIAQLDGEGNYLPGTVDSGFAVAVGQDGTGGFVSPGATGSIGVELDDLGIWQRALTEEEVGRVVAFGNRGRDLDLVLDSVLPFVSSGTPVDGDSNANPDGKLSWILQDSFTRLVPTSVIIYLDDRRVTPQLTSPSTGLYQLSYEPPQLLPSNSDHHYQVQFSDDSSPAVSQTIDLFFSIGRYRNYRLPAPIFLEDFDGTTDAPLQEGTLPEGWTVENASDHRTPVEDLDDKNSDTYLNWTVISGERATNLFGLNRGLIKNWQVVNDRVLTKLIDGQLCYANSGGRPGVVYQLLYSPDIDLTTQSNVFLVYHSVYSQNQDSMGAVEYSINQGQTWWPVVYMLDGSPSGDIVHTEEGWVDAAATLSRSQRDGVRFVDPYTGEPSDGSYGSLIGVTPDRLAELGPYISARFDDDQLESKRVEFFRLPLADHQPKVRFRFMNCGTDSWYFGIDHVGLYSLEQPVPDLTMNVVGSYLYLEWGPFGVLQAASDVNGPWVDLTTVDHTFKVPTSVDSQFYRAITR